MAETYDIALSISVVKSKNMEPLEITVFNFNNLKFADMANHADLFYELIAKLQKEKK